MLWLVLVTFQKPSQSSLKKATERTKRDLPVAGKSTMQTHKSEARSSKWLRPSIDGENSGSAKTTRPVASPPSKTKSQDSLPSGTNPRRNPATFHLEGHRLDRGKERRQETTSESQSNNTQASAQPRKSSVKKKVV